MEIKFETINDVSEIAALYARGECRVGTLAESAARYVSGPASCGTRHDRAILLRDLGRELEQPAADVVVAIAYALMIGA